MWGFRGFFKGVAKFWGLDASVEARLLGLMVFRIRGVTSLKSGGIVVQHLIRAARGS